MNTKSKVLIFIVSYNAEAFIKNVLIRIPQAVWENEFYNVEVLVIDDQSKDKTFHQALEFARQHKHRKITCLSNPVNQGYGGNQKLGYHYAINEDFDVVVLLHGDGQYDPSYLDAMVKPIVSGQADVVLGSRMIHRLDALRGRMPLYKWIGNQILTLIQNRILGSNLSEFHTGYRAYRIASLKSVPFEQNSNTFDFDTDILIQMINTKKKIVEIEIPTYYGDEISYVNGLMYAIQILLTTFRSRLIRLNLLYDVRFDYSGKDPEIYTLKRGYPSSHQFALDRVSRGMVVLDLGSGPGYMAKELESRGAKVISLDRIITPMTKTHSLQAEAVDIENFEFSSIGHPVNMVLMLDIIEHILDPENLLLHIRNRFAGSSPPVIIITTGNIGFFVVRFGMLFGQFNYGKKGILDLDHRRLFTYSSMRRLLKSAGYEILDVKGIPAPYPEAIGKNWTSSFLLGLNRALIYISRGLFSYQMAFIVKPNPTIDHLLEHARNSSEQLVNQIE